MLTRDARRVCVFHFFCAAHVPAGTRYTAAAPTPTLPTHSNPAGQVHVPRVWEITGKADDDRRRAVREWRNAYSRRHELVHA